MSKTDKKVMFSSDDLNRPRKNPQPRNFTSLSIKGGKGRDRLLPTVSNGNTSLNIPSRQPVFKGTRNIKSMDARESEKVTVENTTKFFSPRIRNLKK